MAIANLTVKFRRKWWVTPLLRSLNAAAPIIRRSRRATALVVRAIPLIARYGLEVTI